MKQFEIIFSSYFYYYLYLYITSSRRLLLYIRTTYLKESKVKHQKISFYLSKNKIKIK